MASWKEMSGEERYRVVELAQSGTVSMNKLCETFAVTRQMLGRVVEKAKEGARAALEPQRPGRKGKGEEDQRITELSKKQSSLEKEVSHWKMRYEVAQAYIDLMRQQGREEVPEAMSDQKKPRRKRRGSSGKLLARRDGPVLSVVDDGAGVGGHGGEPAAVAGTEGNAKE